MRGGVRGGSGGLRLEDRPYRREVYWREPRLRRVPGRLPGDTVLAGKISFSETSLQARISRRSPGDENRHLGSVQNPPVACMGPSLNIIYYINKYS